MVQDLDLNTLSRGHVIVAQRTVILFTGDATTHYLGGGHDWCKAGDIFIVDDASDSVYLQLMSQDGVKYMVAKTLPSQRTDDLLRWKRVK